MQKALCLGAVVLGLGWLVVTASAQGLRQSNGRGRVGLEVLFESVDYDAHMTSSDNQVPATWNQTYGAPVSREVWTVRASIGVWDAVDVFAAVAYADDTWHARVKATGANTQTQVGTDARWSAGLKGTVGQFLQDRVEVSYLVQYSYLKTGRDGFAGAPNPSDQSVRWHQVQADLEVASATSVVGLTPFVGIEFFQSKAKQVLETSTRRFVNRYENDDDFAWFAGVRKRLTDHLRLTVEGFWEGREGVAFGAGWLF